MILNYIKLYIVYVYAYDINQRISLYSATLTFSVIAQTS